MLYEVITVDDINIEIAGVAGCMVSPCHHDDFLPHGICFDLSGNTDQRICFTVITSYSIHYTKLYDRTDCHLLVGNACSRDGEDKKNRKDSDPMT